MEEEWFKWSEMSLSDPLDHMQEEITLIGLGGQSVLV